MSRYFAGTTTGYATSDDLVTWTRHPIPSASADVYTVFRSGGLSYACASIGTWQSRVLRNPTASADLADWSGQDVTGGSGSNIMDAAEIPGRMALADLYSTVWYSDDAGVSWQSTEFSAGASGGQGINGWGITYHKGRWVLCASQFTIWSSADMVGWAWEFMGGTQYSTNIQGIVSNGTRLCAVTENGQIWTATDLGAWTLAYTAPGINLRGITWANGRFVATGSSGCVVVSTDGLSWVQVSTGSSTWVRRCVFEASANRYIVGSDSGEVYTSTDALSWTLVSDAAFPIYDIDFGADQAVDAPTIYPASGTLQGVQLVVIQGQGTIRYTVDGSEPTASSPVYTAPFRLASSATVKAKAFQNSLESTTATSVLVIQGADFLKIPSYTAATLPYLLEQYKGDNP